MLADPLADLAQAEGIPSAVAAARSAVDAVLRDRGLRVVSPERTAGLLVAGARASAALEEFTVSQRTDLSGRSPDRAGGPDWLPGTVRLSTELGVMSKLIRVAPGQVLARCHTLVAHGLVAQEDLGRVRPGPELAARLVSLQDLLTHKTSASALVLGAVVHAEIATLAPFVEANGLIARAVEHLVLIDGRIDPLSVIALEVGHAQDPQRYLELLQGYAAGSLTGVREWILHCARCVTVGAEQFASVRV